MPTTVRCVLCQIELKGVKDVREHRCNPPSKIYSPDPMEARVQQIAQEYLEKRLSEASKLAAEYREMQEKEALDRHQELKNMFNKQHQELMTALGTLNTLGKELVETLKGGPNVVK